MLHDSKKGRWGPHLPHVDSLVVLGLAVVAVIGGTVLAAFALIPDIELVRTETLHGNLNASSQQNLSFPVDVGLTELRLEVGNCTVFVTALNEPQWSHYNASGELPNPQLTCGERSATFYYQLRALILQNDGLSPEAYQILARLYAVRSSRAKRPGSNQLRLPLQDDTRLECSPAKLACTAWSASPPLTKPSAAIRHSPASLSLPR